ncbi:MAG TPA: DmsC/YnfH family molybdoenzyme membrane anchor subunit [Pirellulales bacterium]|jgi:Fe-S-cluster-containing dehydrogenase component/DMSO reductase anchor subunit|nr:DmsC/YnfH family molybdoenzyme membrane anchor subunit [Pirellulales bacterium]
MSTAIQSIPDRRALSAPIDTPSLVDLLLAEQLQLTAVERFAQFHEQEVLPLAERYYSALMPADAPAPGEQFAFEVDLDRCSGCKACVTACHTLNGLDDDESWREVGLLHGGTPELPIVQHATTACHHCLEPACMSACPVRAYEKHPQTGIVKHLDDQCIGCQYCVFACPYDVPKYNPQRGIVRKCDMCSQRLAVGEAPACVQACPHQAIRIAVVNRAEIVARCETKAFLPGAPEPSLTLPTTKYKSKRALPIDLLPADYYAVKPEHAHWPLIVMLVLTQLSVGAFLVESVMWQAQGEGAMAVIRPVHAASALVLGLTALAVSVLHLGRPRHAFRVVLGLRTSWLSREIVTFGLFAGAAAAYALSAWATGDDAPRFVNGHVTRALGFAVVGLGIAGVCCSAMVYARTRRAFWNTTDTTLKFLLTSLDLGAATALCTSMVTAAWFDTIAAREIMASYGRPLCQVLVVSMAAKLLLDASVFRHLCHGADATLRRSAVLMTGELAAAAKTRFICGFAGGIAIPGMLLATALAGSSADTSDRFVCTAVCASFAACLAGELIERYLFFTAVSAPKMPGGLG